MLLLNSPFDHKSSERTRVRRKRRCHEILWFGSAHHSGSKQLSFKIPFIFFCLFFFAGSVQSFAQLTYTNLAVQYDDAWTCGKLQLIPVRFKDSGQAENGFNKAGIIGFEQALREGKISVKETNTPGGDDVGLLEVKNHSKKNILVNSGEIVAGGMQDRAFATTTLIPPGTDENYLPVFCIEKGRWDRKFRSFRYGGPADAALRKQIDVSQKQNKVWKEIDKQLIENNVNTISGAYIDLYKDTSKIDTSCMRFFKNKLIDSDSAYSGFVAITGNRIINCELFGSSDLCTASFDVMLKSCMRSIGAGDGEATVSKETVKIFLDKFLETEPQQQLYLTIHGRLYSNNGRAIRLIAYTD